MTSLSRAPIANLLTKLALAAVLLAVPASLVFASTASAAPRRAYNATTAPLTTSRATDTGTTAPPAGTSSRHPYSDPRYLPLRSEFYLDCVHNNPGCKHGGHTTWQMDLIPFGQYYSTGTPSRARVYAMGSGILHIGDANGLACPASTTSYGTWVWIDHGAGNISRYGHLSQILVPNGSLVKAGQPIGIVGTTGKGAACNINYTDVMVERGGLQNANSVEIKTLRACVGRSARAALWPRDTHHARYASWNVTTWHTVFPATTNSCVSPAVPQSARTPRNAAFLPSGKGQLTARWASPSARARVDRVMVEFAAYHTSTKAWDESDHQKYASLRPATAGQEFTGLLRNHTYRMRVTFHNAWGWSRASAWRYQSAS